jgi:ABC-type multidrug transport system fused ATPase/permease subunit
MNKTFRKLCTPAKIYFGIAVIASIFALFRGFTLSVVYMKIFFAFIWTYILSWLCNKGYSYISWFLVLLPYIVIFLAMLRMANVNQKNVIFRNVGLQGAYGEEAMSHMNNQEAMHHMKKQEAMHHMNNQEGMYHMNNQEAMSHMNNQETMYSEKEGLKVKRS